MKSPLRWLGSKTRVASTIVSLLAPHEHYVEVFAGSLAVLFAKARTLFETVNDANSDIVNFWLALRDQGDALVEKLRCTPYSRALFLEWREDGRVEDNLEWAARWFFLVSSSFSSLPRGGWSYLRARNTVNVPPAAQFRRMIGRFAQVRKRLENVQIECADYKTMFDRYAQDPDNLLYVDPPYRGFAEYYDVRFSDEDHVDLIDLCKEANARIALSCMDADGTHADLPGWIVHKMEMTTHAPLTRAGGSKRTRTELLLTNYELQPDLFRA